MLVPGSFFFSMILGKYNRFVFRDRNVSARNVFRYLYSIFMFAAFLVIFVFAPLVLFLSSLVLGFFRVRVRAFLHIVYLAFIVIFASVLR